ncbi:methyltransferase family protein [Paraburkholderia sp. BL8N3]|nr:methyltransferase domain-containing protein [Paraburkholderia sp. BL8N3]TCK43960.1 methyltransferase family protein [Paraburkholderia sp. BL8N3]
MERREKLIGGINLSSAVCAEIGALCNPVLKKTEANVVYVDYADAETLRKHYSGNPSVYPDRIVETDAIWGDQTLSVALKKPVDFIVASHVVEHVPDLVAWLNELHSALTEGGEVRLAVPDRRFTFDFLRRETELSDVLAAYLTSPRVPQPVAILDYFLNATEVDAAAAWRGEVTASNLRRSDTFDAAMATARDSLERGVYHDAHCWVFTPQSFAILLSQLSARGLINFACDKFHDTERDSIEFFVAMRVSDDRDQNARSWELMASAARDFNPKMSKGPEAFEPWYELKELDAGDMQNALREEKKRSALFLAELHDAQAALARSRADVDLLRRSTSWKLTQPLRWLSMTLKGQRI